MILYINESPVLESNIKALSGKNNHVTVTEIKNATANSSYRSPFTDWGEATFIFRFLFVI
jgi:hypothetical protein